MVNIFEVTETNDMIQKENLDVRTITMGISLLECVDADIEKLCRNILDKICRVAKDLVRVGDEIGREYGIPIVNKRISVTPISLVGASACKTSLDYVHLARTLDEAAQAVGVHFIGGFSALVRKSMTATVE
jgi:uncharacterized protein (UPF0210 family)